MELKHYEPNVYILSAETVILDRENLVLYLK